MSVDLMPGGLTLAPEPTVEPCPCCGALPKRQDRDAGMNGTPGWYARLVCECGLIMEQFTSTDGHEAVDAWNRRA